MIVGHARDEMRRRSWCRAVAEADLFLWWRALTRAAEIAGAGRESFA